MSRIRAAANANLARADHAFRALSHHCLVECQACRANRRESCPKAWELHRAWSQARKEAHR